MRPVDFIRNLYPNIVNRLSAFKFAFHPRASKLFNRHKRSRDTSEEYCNEKWDRRKKIFSGYLHPISSVKNYFQGLEQSNVSKKYQSKSVHRKRQKLSELRNNPKSLIVSIAISDLVVGKSIITDSDLVEISSMQYSLPGFRPPDMAWQVN